MSSLPRNSKEPMCSKEEKKTKLFIVAISLYRLLTTESTTEKNFYENRALGFCCQDIVIQTRVAFRQHMKSTIPDT